MLVPALRAIQDRHGYLPREELEFLALRRRIPLYQIQEVASFFPHFRRTAPPPVTVQVCRSMACHLRGSAGLMEAVRRDFAADIAAGRLAVEGVSCLGRCDRAPFACLGLHGFGHAGSSHEHYVGPLTSDGLGALVRAGFDGQAPRETGANASDRPLWQLDVYDARHGGTPPEPYGAVRRFLAARAEDAAKASKGLLGGLREAGLFGMGGAAARTFKKWEDVAQQPGDEKYVVCNADESEPGTFKDREILLHAPHTVVEGMLLAGLLTGAQRGYIYIRHEYHEQVETVERAIREAERAVPEAAAACRLEVFVSPGLYICGEESALIEVIEGHRAQPRNKPPNLAANGLFGKPTLVNNVETFAWVPAILLRPAGGAWAGGNAWRFFSVSGDVARPNAFEVPVSTTLGQLIGYHAGGLRDGLSLKAVAPSGPSGGFLPPRLPADPLRQLAATSIPALRKRDERAARRVQEFNDGPLARCGPELDIFDLPLDVQVFRALGLSLGAGIVVYGEGPGRPLSVLDQARNCLDFFHKESCGKCVPCRLGCQQLVHLTDEVRGRPAVVAPAVRELARVMEATSICGLGRAAATPLITVLDYFPPEQRK
jgi:NADH:ubiquinone oxidoreductase subunit F (NADH-binding)/NADH:ubiquinone oxidoreductase subunit E